MEWLSIWTRWWRDVAAVHGFQQEGVGAYGGKVQGVIQFSECVC